MTIGTSSSPTLGEALAARGVPDWLISSGLLSPSLSRVGGGGSPAGMSRHASAKACERLYAFRYLGYSHGLGVVDRRIEKEGSDGGRFFLSSRDEPEARFFGTLIHGVLAYHEVAKMPRSMQPDWFFEMNAQQRLEFTAGERSDLIAHVIYCYGEYLKWWKDDVEPTVGAELTYVLPIEMIYSGAEKHRYGIPYSVALDRLVVSVPGKALDIIDYKSKNRGGWGDPDSLSRWSPSVMAEFQMQAMAYLTTARAAGLPVRAFRIRRVKRGVFDSDDHVMPMPRTMYREVPRILYAYACRSVDIHKKLLDGGVAMPDYSSCWTRYGICDYGSVCLAASEEEAAVRLESYIMSRAKPELPKAEVAEVTSCP